MKKLLLSILLLVAFLSPAWAGPQISGSGGGVATGTLTNGYICTYTSTGTLITCNTNPAGFQTADTALTTLASKLFAASALTGGAAGALDAIAVAGIADGDIALVGTTDGNFYSYTYEASSATAESSPSVIKPDDNSGNGRWILQYHAVSGVIQLGTVNVPSNNTGATAGSAGNIVHHADSTASNSGGALEMGDGAQVQTVVTTGTNYTIITKTEYIPIAYAEDGAAAPAAATVWADTRKAKIRVFAADADDDVEIHWVVPNDYVGGIKFRAIGFVDNATAPADTETVIMNLAGCSVGDSDDGGCTLGTGVNATFTANATYAQHDRWSTAWSNEITVTDIAAGESVMLKLFRDVDDTYGQGIGVAGIEIKYKAKIIGIGGY